MEVNGGMLLNKSKKRLQQKLHTTPHIWFGYGLTHICQRSPFGHIIPPSNIAYSGTLYDILIFALNMELREYLQKIDGIAPKATDETRTITVEGFELTVKPGIWNPDRGKSSSMFIETLKEYSLEGITSALDTGTGSGILALILKKRGVQCVKAVDKSEDSVKVANQNFQANRAEIVAVESDLFSNIGGKFDLVVFNAPATHPTRRQMAEVMPTLWSPEENLIKRFLQEWKDHKTSNGRALIMYSKFPDFNPLDGDTLDGFNWRIIKEQKGEMSESGIIEIRE